MVAMLGGQAQINNEHVFFFYSDSDFNKLIWIDQAQMSWFRFQFKGPPKVWFQFQTGVESFLHSFRNCMCITEVDPTLPSWLCVKQEKVVIE